MERITLDILIVGPQGPFREIFDHLETRDYYHIHYAADYLEASGYLNEHVPGAIILTIGVDEQNFAEEMEWLHTMKKDAPVLVLSPSETAHQYKTVMQHGAFDFFTAYAQPEEIDFELDSAISRQPCPVA